MNGANEEAVAAFLHEEIRFVEIAKTLASVMRQLDETLQQLDMDLPAGDPHFLRDIHSLEDAGHADQWGREQARKVLDQVS